MNSKVILSFRFIVSNDRMVQCRHFKFGAYSPKNDVFKKLSIKTNESVGFVIFTTVVEISTVLFNFSFISCW